MASHICIPAESFGSSICVKNAQDLQCSVKPMSRSKTSNAGQPPILQNLRTVVLQAIHDMARIMPLECRYIAIAAQVCAALILCVYPSRQIPIIFVDRGRLLEHSFGLSVTSRAYCRLVLEQSSTRQPGILPCGVAATHRSWKVSRHGTISNYLAMRSTTIACYAVLPHLFPQSCLHHSTNSQEEKKA